ncbi:MAG: hypothetical protein KC517_09150 [Bacteroidetes bacterium]|nr:hypothetical protein [Bacteroidota bacterium]
MLTPSNPTEFNAAAISTVRQSVGRVTITWTDPYLDASILASAPGQENRVNWPKQVANLIETVPYKWFHLDGLTPLSAGMHPAPSTEVLSDSYEMGWWGAEVSGAGGSFTNPQVLTISFSARPILDLRVVGDSAYSEYPVDFNIQVLDQAAALLYSENVTGNAALVWTNNISSENITEGVYIVLTITKWSAVSRVVKITECYTSISNSYDGDEIFQMNFSEEAEIKDGTLPIGNISANSFDLALNNVDNKFFPGNTEALLHTLVIKNRKIVAEIGFIFENGVTEYVPAGTYWSGDWKTSETGTRASTTALDRMGLLRKTTFYPGVVYVGYTLGELAEVVLEDAKLIQPDLQYSIDSDLDDFIIPYGWFKKQSHFKALKLIAQASLGRVYVDRQDVIQVDGMATEEASVYEITADNYFSREQPANSEDISNVIEVITQPFVPNSSPTTGVYESSEDLVGVLGLQIVNITYKTPPISNAVITATFSTGSGSVNGVLTEYYAWGAAVAVDCSAAGLYRISVDGVEYNTDGAVTVIKTDSDSIRKYGRQTYETKKNPLVQNTAVAELIAETLLEVYKDPQKDVSLSWRGNPVLELGDPVTIPEYVKGTVNQKGVFRMTRQKIQWDGALSAKFEGRKVSAAETAAAYQDTDGVAAVWQDVDGATIKIQG